MFDFIPPAVHHSKTPRYRRSTNFSFAPDRINSNKFEFGSQSLDTADEILALDLLKKSLFFYLYQNFEYIALLATPVVHAVLHEAWSK